MEKMAVTAIVIPGMRENSVVRPMPFTASCGARPARRYRWVSTTAHRTGTSVKST